MDYKEEIIKQIKEIEPCNLSYTYNSVMVELGEYDLLIWSIDHLKDDIEQGMFNTDWNVLEHLIEDDFSIPTADTVYIALDSNCNFTNMSYDDVIEQLKYILSDCDNEDDKDILQYALDCI